MADISYRYQRPSSVKLAGVKHRMYHPRLPTLRKMDMDTATHRLPTEHSRTTTPCASGDFVGVKSTQISRRQPLHCKNVLHTNTATAIKSYQPISTQNYTENWKMILESIHIPTSQRDAVKLQVSGLVMRSTPPAIAHSWQYSRPSRELYRPTIPMPMVATLYSRYRTIRLYSPNPWK